MLVRNVKFASSIALAFLCISCGGDDSSGAGPTPTPTATPTPTPTPTPTAPQPVTGVQQSAAIATFNFPWSVKVLPDLKLLVSQRSTAGALFVVGPTGEKSRVDGLPTNIGVLDVLLDPGFSINRKIYFTCMVQDRTAPRVGRAADEAGLFPERMMAFSAVLLESGQSAALNQVTEIFRQVPTIVAFEGSGEPGGRMAFAADGTIFITSGDRQELDTELLFSLENNLGKTVRILPDGRAPNDNPFASTAGARKEIWTLGHRNHYGLSFSPNGELWSSEMGPKGGDEFNLILPGLNYGWNAVSNGSYYDDGPIPDHSAGDGFEAPKISWTPVVAPAGMIFYRGNIFGDWRGDALITGLQYHGLVRIRTEGRAAQEVQRIDLGARIRDIAEGPDGSLYVLTDGSSGELRKLTPIF